jgi:aspartate kinase
MERLIETIDYSTHMAKITLQGVVNRHGVAGEIFSILGRHGLNIELISTCQTGRNRADISFAVHESNAKTVIKILESIKGRYGRHAVLIDQDCAMINIYGPMLGNTPGIAGDIFGILAERKINIEMINASLSGLNLVVQKDQVMDAVAALRTEFGI